MNVNPMMLLQMIKNGRNPQQLMMNILQQQSRNNPILENAMNLAGNNDTNALEKLARNLAEQRGINFDEAFGRFKKFFN